MHKEVLEGCDVVRLTHTEPVLRGHAHRLHHPRGYRVWECEVDRRRTFWSVVQISLNNTGNWVLVDHNNKSQIENAATVNFLLKVLIYGGILLLRYQYMT